VARVPQFVYITCCSVTFDVVCSSFVHTVKFPNFLFLAETNGISIGVWLTRGLILIFSFSRSISSVALRVFVFGNIRDSLPVL